MKNVYIYIGLVVMVMGMALTSCENGSAYDERDFALTKKPEPTTPKDTTASNPWGKEVKNDLIPIGEPTPTTHMWHGVQTFYRYNEVLAKNDTLVKTVEMPVSYELTPSEGFSFSKTGEKPVWVGETTFTALSSNTSYGEWEKDSEGNMRKQMRNTFSLQTTEFAKTLSLSRFQAYSTVDGREHAFRDHAVSARVVSLDSISAKEVERNDSIYEYVTYEITVDATFADSKEARCYHIYRMTARHTIAYFLRMKPADPTTPTTAPTDWKYILASLVVNPNGAVEGSKGAFSICICLKNEKTKQWAIAITKTFGKNDATDFETYYFSFSDYPTTAKVNSAIMYNGTWVPAYLNRDIKDSKKWWYEGKYNNLSISMQEADMMGIKNFTGNHTAENTAWLNAWGSDYATDGSLQVHNAKGLVVFTIK